MLAGDSFFFSRRAKGLERSRAGRLPCQNTLRSILFLFIRVSFCRTGPKYFDLGFFFESSPLPLSVLFRIFLTEIMNQDSAVGVRELIHFHPFFSPPPLFSGYNVTEKLPLVPSPFLFRLFSFFFPSSLNWLLNGWKFFSFLQDGVVSFRCRVKNQDFEPVPFLSMFLSD